jgi:hypothetical protein
MPSDWEFRKTGTWPVRPVGSKRVSGLKYLTSKWVMSTFPLSVADVISSVLKGFMLLRTDRAGRYRGVDREPFEPLIQDDAHVPSQDSDAISDFYPTGWKHDLYRIAESDCVDDCGFLFSRITTAVAIQERLTKHVGPYEIVWAEIAPVSGQLVEETEGQVAGQFLGYDLAYLGGDFYSALLNGLVVNPDPALQAMFGASLNEFELFAARDAAPDYLAVFRTSVLSESMSEFYIYALRLVARNDVARVTRAN